MKCNQAAAKAAAWLHLHAVQRGSTVESNVAVLTTKRRGSLMLNIDELLRTPVLPLYTLPTAVVCPVTHSDHARQRLSGGLRIFIEASPRTKVPTWIEMDGFANMSPGSLLLSSTKRCVRPIPPEYAHSPYSTPDAIPATVFELLAYLVKAGPLEAMICAPEPVQFPNGSCYVALWAPIGVDERGLVLWRVHTLNEIDDLRHTLRLHWLISEPVAKTKRV